MGCLLDHISSPDLVWLDYKACLLPIIGKDIAAKPLRRIGLMTIFETEVAKTFGDDLKAWAFSRQGIISKIW